MTYSAYTLYMRRGFIQIEDGGCYALFSYIYARALLLRAPGTYRSRKAAFLPFYLLLDCAGVGGVVDR